MRKRIPMVYGSSLLAIAKRRHYRRRSWAAFISGKSSNNFSTDYTEICSPESWVIPLQVRAGRSFRPPRFSPPFPSSLHNPSILYSLSFSICCDDNEIISFRFKERFVDATKLAIRFLRYSNAGYIIFGRLKQRQASVSCVNVKLTQITQTHPLLIPNSTFNSRNKNYYCFVLHMHNKNQV